MSPPPLACATCGQRVGDAHELESHVAADHLDYFPYGCGHCGHWLATDTLMRFHADTRGHLPVKIRENLSMSKERELRAIVAKSLKDQNGGGPHSESSSCVSAATAGGGQPQRSPNAPGVEQAHASAYPSPMGNEPKAKRPRLTPDSEQHLAGADVGRASPASEKSTRHLRHTRPAYEEEASKQADSPSALGAAAALESAGSPVPPPRDDAISDDHTFNCAVCRQKIALCHLEKHARAHYKLPGDGYMYACVQCEYVGRSSVSVVTHFTHRHGKRASRENYVPIEAKDGVRELTVEETTALIIEKCFNGGGGGAAAKQEADEAVLQLEGGQPPQANMGQSNEGDDVTFPAIGDDYMQSWSAPRLPNYSGPYLGTAKRLVKSAHKRTLKSRVRPHLTCDLCGARVYSAVAAQHVYEQHVRLSDTVQCGHCDFGSMYSATPVLQHMQHMHQGAPVSQVRDRRKDPHRQALYLEYRDKCFPNVFNRAPNGSVLPPKNPFYGSEFAADTGAASPRPVDTSLEGAGGGTESMSHMERELHSDRQFDLAATPGRAPHSSQMAGRSFNTAKCRLCDSDVIFMQRHAWRHLYNEKSTVPFRCLQEGCAYKTYLKRSFDSHHESMHRGMEVKLSDRRRKYAPQLAEAMERCFDKALIFKPGSHMASAAGGGAGGQAAGGDSGDSGSAQLAERESSPLGAPAAATVPADGGGEEAGEKAHTPPPASAAQSLKCRICNVAVAHDQAREHVQRRHVRRPAGGGGTPSLPNFTCNHCGQVLKSEAEAQRHGADEHPDLPASSTGGGDSAAAVDTEALRGEWYRCFGVRTPFLQPKVESAQA